MTPSFHDLCFLFTKSAINLDKEQKPAALLCFQTDNSLFLVNEEFVILEEEKSKRFERKLISKLVVAVPMRF